jgi:hypothetical protein
MKRLCIFLAFAFLLTVAVNAAESKTEILYWTHEDPNRTEIENKYIEEFEKANPGVTVKRVTSPSKKMAERVLTAFAAMVVLLPSTTRLPVIPVLRLFMMRIFPKRWIRLPMGESYMGCPWN